VGTLVPSVKCQVHVSVTVARYLKRVWVPP